MQSSLPPESLGSPVPFQLEYSPATETPPAPLPLPDQNCVPASVLSPTQRQVPSTVTSLPASQFVATRFGPMKLFSVALSMLASCIFVVLARHKSRAAVHDFASVQK